MRTERAAARRTAERRGRAAEGLAAWYLRLRGYRILARRFRTAVGEIDIVARRGEVVAFVEVKARPTAAGAAESLGPRQRRRVAEAASLWLASHPAEDRAVRFDVLLIIPWRMPCHIVDAFRPEV